MTFCTRSTPIDVPPSISLPSKNLVLPLVWYRIDHGYHHEFNGIGQRLLRIGRLPSECKSGRCRPLSVLLSCPSAPRGIGIVAVAVALSNLPLPVVQEKLHLILPRRFSTFALSLLLGVVKRRGPLVTLS